MTITEHLEFSVVAAPLAQFDRRTLSQAWYSALYRADAPAAVPAKVHAQPQNARGNERRAASTNESAAARATARDAGAQAQRRSNEVKPLPLALDRRSTRSPLARSIERRFLQPANRSSHATFALGSGAGRVQVLLNARGPQMQLVALCAPAARAQVCVAIAQARYALAARGLALTAETRTVRA